MNTKPFILFAVILLVLTAGCLSENKSAFVDKPSIRNYDLATDSLQQKVTGENAANNDGGAATQVDRKVISTANLVIEVKSAKEAFNEIINLTQVQGGFISNSYIYDAGGRNNGQFTIKVPAKNFYTAISQIEPLGTLKTRQITGQDVTEEFIDLNARLDNLKKQEVRLQEILKIANTVKEVLEVEHELERVRGEIERLTGRMNYLGRSVEMSTISVTMTEPVPITGTEGWGISEAIREAIKGFVESVRGIIIFVGYALPIVIFGIIVIVILLKLKRKIVKG
jgi:outer membrane murein-binding lipoprotein Lpp